MKRMEGDNIEEFKLSMCYLDLPAQITASPEKPVFYIDTSSALALGKEVKTIEINPIHITQITDPDAIQCEFIVSVSTTFAGMVSYNEPMLEVEVDLDAEQG